jgi:hypothetical protein
MINRSDIYETAIAPTIWVLGVVLICVFASQNHAILKTDGVQTAVLISKKPV